MVRRIATGARATLLTATDFTIADGLFGSGIMVTVHKINKRLNSPRQP
jgi:hypothetical protein